MGIEKFAREYSDYGYGMPAGVYYAAWFHVEKDIDLLVEKIYPFVKAHKKALKGAFYGDPLETLTSGGYTFGN